MSETLPLSTARKLGEFFLERCRTADEMGESIGTETTGAKRSIRHDCEACYLREKDKHEENLKEEVEGVDRNSRSGQVKGEGEGEIRSA